MLLSEGEGIRHIDYVLQNPNSKTGKQWSSIGAVDELARMVEELQSLTHHDYQEDYPLTPREKRILYIVSLAIGNIATILRQRVVTEKE